MELSSTRIVAAPVETVWAALNDPEMLKGCVPGCDAIEADGENAYRISMAAKVGPVSAKFAGRMLLSDVDPPRSYTLAFEGQGGAAGFAKGEAKVALAPEANGTGTALSYAVKAQVGGKIAQLGSRLVDGAAQKLADDFFGRFADAVGVKAGAAPRIAPAGPPRRMPRWKRVLIIIIVADILFWLWYWWR
jgi:carbon monoxide dehydrogenase subunit G